MAGARAAERPPARRRDPALPSAGDEASLDRRLSEETRDAHVAAERGFDLERRLESLRGYGDALLALHAWSCMSAPALEGLAAALPAPLRDGPARRRARLDADLAVLGRAPGGPLAPGALPALDRDGALGVWYVHEGAALGGLVIAAEVRRRLPAAAPATRFFAGEGRATARRWRSVRDVLAGWAPGDAEVADRVLAGARATFGALITAMDEAAA